jgi:hypothetical protein
MSAILLDAPLTTFSYEITRTIGGIQIFVPIHLKIPLQWSFVCAPSFSACGETRYVHDAHTEKSRDVAGGGGGGGVGGEIKINQHNG